MINFREVIVKDGRFSYINRRAAESYEWKVSGLTSTARGMDKPIRVEINGKFEKTPERKVSSFF